MWLCVAEGTSWSVSESDITGNMVVEEDAEDVDGESTAPDGGWGWVVVIASFMIHLIADGATFSFGVIYVELLQYFKESRGYTAWIGGLFMAMPLLSGPLASSLADRYGCRAVTIVGSVLAAIGFVLSSISSKLLQAITGSEQSIIKSATPINSPVAAPFLHVNYSATLLG